MGTVSEAILRGMAVNHAKRTSPPVHPRLAHPRVDLVAAEGDAFEPVGWAAGVVGLAECEIVRRVPFEN